jgi:hypothetical protein
MATDWKLRSHAHVCAVSGNKLAVGDSVVSFVYKNQDGELIRSDVLEELADGFSVEKILGRWQFVIPDKKRVKLGKTEELKSLESFFFSLYDSAESNDSTLVELKFYLSQMLEKKRSLFEVRKENHRILYRHRESKSEFWVDSIQMEREGLLQFVNTVADVLSLG